MQREAAKSRAEFAELKDECAHLRQRIQDIECEMKKSNMENNELKHEYMQLQESYKQLEMMKDTLQDVQATCQLNLTDAQKEADRTRNELADARCEILLLQEKCREQQVRIEALESDLQGTLSEYGVLAFHCRTLSTCAMAPLFLLLFAIIIAFYPALATVTATSTPLDDT
jgi:chromosome segregation ATPase